MEVGGKGEESSAATELSPNAGVGEDDTGDDDDCCRDGGGDARKSASTALSLRGDMSGDPRAVVGVLSNCEEGVAGFSTGGDAAIRPELDLSANATGVATLASRGRIIKRNTS